VHAAIGANERKGVEHADGALVAVEHLAEVGLAQPAVLARADLDAHGRRHHRRPSDPPREVRFAKSAGANHPVDLVLQVRFGTLNEVAGGQQLARRRTARLRARRRPRRHRPGIACHWSR
jgi:hypothetical protein